VFSVQIATAELEEQLKITNWKSYSFSICPPNLWFRLFY